MGGLSRHALPAGLADGTLPEERFRTYLTQDCLCLIHYARACGLVLRKSNDLDEMRVATRLLSGLMDTELDMHVRFGPRVA